MQLLDREEKRSDESAAAESRLPKESGRKTTVHRILTESRMAVVVACATAPIILFVPKTQASIRRSTEPHHRAEGMQWEKSRNICTVAQISTLLL